MKAFFFLTLIMSFTALAETSTIYFTLREYDLEGRNVGGGAPALKINLTKENDVFIRSGSTQETLYDMTEDEDSVLKPSDRVLEVQYRTVVSQGQCRQGEIAILVGEERLSKPLLNCRFDKSKNFVFVSKSQSRIYVIEKQQ